jgi:hypothetical protein
MGVAAARWLGERAVCRLLPFVVAQIPQAIGGEAV